MQNKYLMVIALLGAMAGLNTGMIASHVQADGTGSCPCGNGKGFWTCANCDSYMNQPQVNKVGETTCHYWTSGNWRCENGPFFSYHQQPTITQTAYFRDNCFWSYPVQCNNISEDGVNLHLRTL